jgi:hypothetical protein
MTRAVILGLGLLAACAGPRVTSPTVQRDVPETVAAKPEERPAPAPAKALDVKVTDWAFQGQAGRRATTQNYELLTTTANEALFNRIPAFMELALKHYRTALIELPPPAKPMRSYLFATRDQWGSYTKQRLPDEADTYLKLGRGGYTTGGETVYYDIGRDTLLIAAHEGWHQYTQTTFRHMLPIWLEEGIATYMEGYMRAEDGTITFMPWRNLERHRALRDAAEDDRLIPLTRLVNGSPQSFLNEGGKSPLLVYYAQVWGLVHFLNEGAGGKYREALRAAISDAAAGKLAGKLATSTNISTRRNRHLASSARSGPWVLLAYFNRDLDEMEKEYDAFVKEITGRDRMNRVWRGESPLLPPDAEEAAKIEAATEGRSRRGGR